jgi:hypothetical protein
VKVPIILQDEEILRRCHNPKIKLRNTKEATIAGDRSIRLFDLGEEGVEVLALGPVIFSQPRLHQTAKAKSVVHTHHAATVRALVVLVQGRGKGISDVIKIHFS